MTITFEMWSAASSRKWWVQKGVRVSLSVTQWLGQPCTTSWSTKFKRSETREMTTKRSSNSSSRLQTVDMLVKWYNELFRAIRRQVFHLIIHIRRWRTFLIFSFKMEKSTTSRLWFVEATSVRCLDFSMTLPRLASMSTFRKFNSLKNTRSLIIIV